MLSNIPGIDFTLKEAASIGIIGGADGPLLFFSPVNYLRIY